jgi:Mg-chelatase subunit ChlI
MNFLSKLGKNVLSAISNMKESNASLMAKVWVKLARSSAHDLEQHSAYNKAIEILRKEESVEVVEVLIEYAEWMQRKKYSSQDVEDQLLLAVDILMDIEPGWDEDEDEGNEEGDDDERKTRKTGKSKSSKFSKGSKAKTKNSKASRAGKSVKKSMAGGKSKVSNASKRSKSMKSGASRSSRKTKTSLSQR